MSTQAQLLEVIKIQSEIAQQGLDLSGVMELIVERILPLVNADGAVIEMLDGDNMTYRATSGSIKSHLGMKIKREGSLAGQCLDQGILLRCDDALVDDRVNKEACIKTNIRSMLVSPLSYKGNPVGVLKVMSQKPSNFTSNEEALLGLVNDTLSAAMYLASKMDSNQLLYQATHDSMTKLANRALFMERLRASTHQHQAGKEDIWVMILDMDGLKYLNDTFGHHIGDQAIRVMADRIKNNCKTKDTVARLGGDEFAVLMEVSPNIKMDILIQRMQDVIEAPFVFEHQTYPLGASIGAANYPNDSVEIDELLMLADHHMYNSKRVRKGVAMIN